MNRKHRGLVSAQLCAYFAFYASLAGAQEQIQTPPPYTLTMPSMDVHGSPANAAGAPASPSQSGAPGAAPENASASATAASQSALSPAPAATNAPALAGAPADAGLRPAINARPAMSSVFVPDAGKNNAPSQESMPPLSAPDVADQAWRTLISRVFEPSRLEYIGSLVTPSQHDDLLQFADLKQSLQAKLSAAAAEGRVSAADSAAMQTELNNVSQEQMKAVAVGRLDYPHALALLFQLNRVKAELEAHSAGREKVETADYFNAKDPVSYRDHLVRKLYFNRMNGRLSSGEYDELRALVDRRSQKLDANMGDKGKSLEAFKRIDKRISDAVEGINH